MATLQDFKVEGIDGGGNLIPGLAGKVVLVVNVASKCGLTPQYTGLQKLQDDLADEGLIVVGFPCNQFGSQEPGTEQEIIQFCQARYDVTFPLTSKIEVNGAGRHPVYGWLTVSFPGDIEWNFEKFLINRKGEVIARFAPNVKPNDEKVVAAIKAALAEK